MPLVARAQLGQRAQSVPHLAQIDRKEPDQRTSVKWLGEGAVSPLAIDGKMANSDLVPLVRQWCASKGKAVVTPSASYTLRFFNMN